MLHVIISPLIAEEDLYEVRDRRLYNYTVEMREIASRMPHVILWCSLHHARHSGIRSCTFFVELFYSLGVTGVDGCCGLWDVDGASF